MWRTILFLFEFATRSEIGKFKDFTPGCVHALRPLLATYYAHFAGRRNFECASLRRLAKNARSWLVGPYTVKFAPPLRPDSCSISELLMSGGIDLILDLVGEK